MSCLAPESPSYQTAAYPKGGSCSSFPLKMCLHEEEKAKFMRPNRDHNSAETEGSDPEMQV